MKVYNQDKSKILAESEILAEYDTTKGRLEKDVIVIHHEGVQGVEPKFREVVTEFENGGKDISYELVEQGVEKVEPYDEYEEIMVYIPYTQEQLDEFNRLDTIFLLKKELQKIKEDVEQVELFGMERTDFETKKQRCIEIILQLRGLELGK